MQINRSFRTPPQHRPARQLRAVVEAKSVGCAALEPDVLKGQVPFNLTA
jgi:hypothetical protein